MTTPGELRDGVWRPYYDMAIRTSVQRGWDCRGVCEHVPQRANDGGLNHGQSGDDWFFALRCEDTAIQLVCFSWIRNGVKIPIGFESHKPTVWGAYLSVHDGRGEERESCHLLAQGCVPQDLGAFGPDRVWGEAESKLLEPHALHPIDELDLDWPGANLQGFWDKLAEVMKEHLQA